MKKPGKNMKSRLSELIKSLRITKESRDILLMFILILIAMALLETINPRVIQTEYEIIDPECRIEILDKFPVGMQDMLKIQIDGEQKVFFVPADTIRKMIYVDCEDGTLEHY